MHFFVLVKVLAVFHEGKLRSAASDLPQNACGQPPIFFCVVVAGPKVIAILMTGADTKICQIKFGRLQAWLVVLTSLSIKGTQMILLSALLQPNKVFWRKSVRKPQYCNPVVYR